MPVHVNDLWTEIISEADGDADGAPETAATDGGGPLRERLRDAQERLTEERLRTRADGFSD